MAEHIKEVRKKGDHTYGDPIPLGADAQYVDLRVGNNKEKNLQEIMGEYKKIHQ